MLCWTLFILSRYKNGDEIIRNTFNVQIFAQTNDSYILQLGIGVLGHAGLKFNMTATESQLGDLIYDPKECAYMMTRFSNSGLIFIDTGIFEQISMCEFSASGITLMNTN